MEAEYEYWQGNDGKWYFHLKAANGEIVHPSQGYVDESGCVRGIETVKRLSPKARIVKRPEAK